MGTRSLPHGRQEPPSARSFRHTPPTGFKEGPLVGPLAPSICIEHFEEASLCRVERAFIVLPDEVLAPVQRGSGEAALAYERRVRCDQR